MKQTEGMPSWQGMNKMQFFIPNSLQKETNFSASKNTWSVLAMILYETSLYTYINITELKNLLTHLFLVSLVIAFLPPQYRYILSQWAHLELFWQYDLNKYFS